MIASLVMRECVVNVSWFVSSVLSVRRNALGALVIRVLAPGLEVRFVRGESALRAWGSSDESRLRQVGTQLAGSLRSLEEVPLGLVSVRMRL